MSAEHAVAFRSFRQVRISAVGWGLVFGATVASSALAYVSSFPDAASRHQLAATTGRDTGVSILLGPISSIDTVAGYTVYKCFVTVTTIAAIWALFAATRLPRGEEDTGRWQLTLSGGTRASRATVATLIGLGLAVAVVMAETTAFTALAGAIKTSASRSLTASSTASASPSRPSCSSRWAHSPHSWEGRGVSRRGWACSCSARASSCA